MSEQLLIEFIDVGDDKKFNEYHRQNPHIYQAFEKKTLEAISRGYKHCSAKGVFEILRWETAVAANHDEYKINNNYTPFYARLFMKNHPEHQEFFRVRFSNFDYEVR